MPILLALALQSSFTADNPLRGSWERCIAEKAAVYASSAEPASDAAVASMAACRAERVAYRSAALQGIDLATRKAVVCLLDVFELEDKEQLILKIVDMRMARTEAAGTLRKR